MGEQFADRTLDGDIELTVYNQDLALVKEKREFDLKIGSQNLEYKDVAAQIYPASVIVEDSLDKSTLFLEQTYEYDLEDNSKLFDKHLGKEITVTDKEGISYTGKLLSHESGIVLQIKDRSILTFTELAKIEFPDPSGLFTKPTLIWQSFSATAGKRDILVSYLTAGISWKAEYSLNVKADYSKASIKSWIIIDNKTGADFENAKLKLVAGEIHRVYAQPPKTRALRGATEKFAAVSEDSFTEESLSEYHLYTLDRLTTFKNNQTKEISFFSANDVFLEKELIFDNWKSDKIQIMLKMENSEEKGPGKALPEGLIRIFKADSGEQLQFLGEDQIEHTPTGGEIKVTVGSVFDIEVNRTQTDYQRISETIERTTYAIKFNNTKSEVQNIRIIEHLSGDWEIIANSDPYEKTDAFTIEFRISMAPKSTKILSYTVENKLKTPVR